MRSAADGNLTQEPPATRNALIRTTSERTSNAALAPHDPCPRILCKAEVNIALADLRYVGDVSSSGDDFILVTSSDGLLEGSASSHVKLEWPSGIDTRPPSLSFRSPTVELSEDTPMLLGPVRVRFGDGRSVVKGKVKCSAGNFTVGQEVDHGGGGVAIVVNGGAGDTLALRGLPGHVAAALSAVTYTPPNNWNGRADGVVTLTMVVQAAKDAEVIR